MLFHLQVDEDGIACPICEKTFTSTIVCSTTDEPSKTNVAPESTVSLWKGDNQMLIYRLPNKYDFLKDFREVLNFAVIVRVLPNLMFWQMINLLLHYDRIVMRTKLESSFLKSILTMDKV